jgi:V-type H+-transporting ATPase subunit H
MLSFLSEAVEKFIGATKFGVIKHICDILQKVSREKITRVAFMIFKNIEEIPGCLELMIDNRLLKIIDTILKGNIKDEELITAIKEIGAILESNIRVLSSFDKYVKELNSETLEWSSVHNERFWKENALKFEANEYHIIKKLKYLLNSKRALNVSVACYDIGEFCRFYPRGKTYISVHSVSSSPSRSRKSSWRRHATPRTSR